LNGICFQASRIYLYAAGREAETAVGRHVELADEGHFRQKAELSVRFSISQPLAGD